MSSDSSYIEEVPVEVVFKKEISNSSEEPPMSEWSSLQMVCTPSDSPKMALYKQGLYYPGSGEICAKYIPQSDSDVLRHVYYNYPAIIDPGIVEALLKPERKKIYPCDGQELYLDLCSEMGLVPARSFHRGLVAEEINLRYYGVNPVGVRAMTMALVNNKYVKRLDLSSNYLTHDACFHLGQLLGESFALQELVLSGCRLGPEGLRQLVHRLSTRSLEMLDLSNNSLGDEGFQYLAKQIIKGAVIKRLNLSNNDLTVNTALAFTEAIEGNNVMTHLDLSWNKMFPQKGSNDLLRMLGDNKFLTELNLSWNALTIGVVLRKVLNLPNLKILDLSNNRLSTAAVKAITFRLPNAKKLHTLDLSHNCLSPADALMMITAMKDEDVKLKNLFMADVAVSKEFIVELNEVLQLKYRADFNITYGKVMNNYTISIPDIRTIILKRLNHITVKAKKCQLDIALYFLETRKVTSTLDPRMLLRTLKNNSAPIDEDLIEELTRTFPGPRDDKGKSTINVDAVVEYINRLWPEKKLPPTPPPVPPPPKPKKKKKKEKGKKK